MTDYLALGIVVAGVVLAAVAQVWLLYRTFQVSEWWGTLLFFLPVLSPLYMLATLRRSWVSAVLLVLGAALVATPLVWKYEARPDLGERLRDVNGELHVTLTGWDRKDYSLLGRLPAVVVLNLANPDVTDDTLRHLTRMQKLRELDLNDSQITDAGLQLLAELPNLQMLHLRQTHITDAGFRTHLLPLESLRTVEVTRTGVKSITLREWKKAKPGRDYIN